MGTMFRDVEEIADNCLERMIVGNSNENTMQWDEWWNRIVGEDVPGQGTRNHELYKRERLAVKNQINDVFAQRQSSCRLHVANTYGLYLLNGGDAVEAALAARFRKAANVTRTTVEQFEELAACDVCPEDAAKLKRLAASAENNFDALVGTIMRMRSLPAATKRLLLNEMGCGIEDN